MRRLHRLSSIVSDNMADSCAQTHTSTYCEQEIIDLHNIFLTNGVHHITVADLDQGRALVQTLLHSLHYYNDMACLTMSHEQLPEEVCDMYTDLVADYGLGISSETIEQFLLERFYFDFMWIEASTELVDSSWYPHFEKKLTDMNIEKLLPVVVLLPDQE